MSKNLPPEIARIMADLESSDEAPTSAEAARQRAAETERDRVRRWYERFLENAPLRGTERAWRPKNSTSVRAVRHWLRNQAGARGRGRPSMHLMLRGGGGCGKSTAAACAVKYWTEYPDERGACAWMKPDQLTSAVLHAYDPTAPRLARWIVLDDIGRETKPGFEEAWCSVLETRGHTLLMTTNLTLEKLTERYDERIVQRLRDTAIAIDIPDDDMRDGDGGF